LQHIPTNEIIAIDSDDDPGVNVASAPCAYPCPNTAVMYGIGIVLFYYLKHIAVLNNAAWRLADQPPVPEPALNIQIPGMPCFYVVGLLLVYCCWFYCCWFVVVVLAYSQLQCCLFVAVMVCLSMPSRHCLPALQLGFASTVM
jgi:hypothetical protein